MVRSPRYMRPDPEFETLVEMHYASLFRFAFSLTRHEQEACDLTQQTFCAWAEKGHQLRDRSKAKSWLFTTLHREFLGRQRKVVRMPQTEMTEEPLEVAESALAPFECADHAAVLDALATVDQPFQAAVALFYLEDYTQPEIAEILNVPVGTVKSRIARGIVQLQQRLLETNRIPTRKETV